MANRSDVIIENKNDKICMLTDAVVSSDRNVIQEEAENKLKYNNLPIEIQSMWNRKCFVIPRITGVTGVLTKGLTKYLEEILGKN
jgi:hypothetical protein